MLVSERSTLNIVLYSCSESEGKSIAEACWGGHFHNGVLTHTTDDHNVNVFLRWPEGNRFANPIGITDVLIVHLAPYVTDTSEIEAYCEVRSNIPVRIVTSTNEGYKSWESKGFIFTNTTSNVVSLSTEGVKAFEERIKGAFNKHNIDGTGINKEQFALVAQELGLDTTSEEFQSSQECNFFISPKITYTKFRSWYVFGSDNPYFWRKFIGRVNVLEYQIGEKLDEISKIFNSVLNGDSSNINEYNGHLSFGATNSFTVGSKFGWELLSGEEYDNSKLNMPFTLSHSPFTFSFEIGIKDDTQVEKAISVLNSLKEMGKSMIPEVEDLIKMGVDLQFRVASPNSFYFDFVVSGLLGGFILDLASKVHFDLLKYSGCNKFYIQSELSPIFVLSKTLDELLQNSCNTEIGGEGKFVNSNTIFKIVSIAISIINQRIIKSKDLDIVFKFINVLKKGTLNLKYDSSQLASAIKENVNARSHNKDKFEKLSNQFYDTQKMFDQYIEQGKQMAMFVEDYIDLIKNINLDKIAFHFNLGIVRTSLQVYLIFNGLTDFINSNILC